MPRKPMTAAQQDLAARFVPLARHLARPLQRAWPSLREDLESAALAGLVEAAQAFDPGRGVRFATFARLRIGGALRDVQRRSAMKGWRADPSAAPERMGLAPDSELQGTVLLAGAAAPPDEDLDARDAVEGWLRKLPPRHAAAMRRLYLHGENQAVAAAAVGCSQSRLCVLHRESLAMLRECAPC